MSKTKNESASRARDIVAAAARLFKEKGYRATTLKDIAAAVRMLKRSLLYCTRSKEELPYLVVRDPIRQVYSELEAIGATALTFTEKIAQAIANHMTVFHLHYPHIAVYLHDYRHLVDKLEQNVIETPKQYQRLWDALLRQGIAAGGIRGDGSPSPATPSSACAIGPIAGTTLPGGCHPRKSRTYSPRCPAGPDSHLNR